MAQETYVIGSKIANMLLGKPKQYNVVFTESSVGLFKGFIYSVNTTIAEGRHHEGSSVEEILDKIHVEIMRIEMYTLTKTS